MFFIIIKNMTMLQYVFSGLFHKMLPNKAFPETVEKTEVLPSAAKKKEPQR